MLKRSLLALAVATVAVIPAIMDRAGRACSYAFDWTIKTAKSVLVGPTLIAPAEVDADPTSRPVVALRRAERYAVRTLKREQPVVTPEWRMVPST